ncbi:MAG: hypothetical protein IT249_02845 [Chitinophagaceae bacterium]|nr:hypothetical protein [Chitinophagaceae bacterium]
MPKTLKHSIAAIFVCIMVCKGLFSIVVALSEHQSIIVSHSELAASENSEKEAEQKSCERDFVPEEFADIVLPVIIAVQKFSHSHYMFADITHLTDLAVFTPPPELV